jgi:hypothetical protein
MKPLPPIRNVSSQRRAIYYAGLTTMAVGFLLFFSTFITGAMHFGDFDHMAERGRSMGLRAFGGFAMIFVGIFLANLGARGLAGSGMMLDPERARRDLEPWARTSGGLTDAAFQEMPTVRETVAGLVRGGDEAPEVVKVRCRACRALNDEHDKYCGQCGKAL